MSNPIPGGVPDDELLAPVPQDPTKKPGTPAAIPGGVTDAELLGQTPENFLASLHRSRIAPSVVQGAEEHAADYQAYITPPEKAATDILGIHNPDADTPEQAAERASQPTFDGPFGAEASVGYGLYHAAKTLFERTHTDLPVAPKVTPAYIADYATRNAIGADPTVHLGEELSTDAPFYGVPAFTKDLAKYVVQSVPRGIRGFSNVAGGLAAMPLNFAKATAAIAVDAVEGGRYLLPEERDNAYQQSVITAGTMYAGSLLGGAFSEGLIKPALVESQIGEEAVRSGASINALMRAGLLNSDDMNALRSSLYGEEARPLTLGRQAISSVSHAVAGGAAFGALDAEEKGGDVIKSAAAYAALAAPLGLLFGGLSGEPTPEDATTANTLAYLRQFKRTTEISPDAVAIAQDAYKEASNFGTATLKTYTRLADRAVVIRGETPEDLNSFIDAVGSKQYAVFHRPDGSFDFLAGGNTEKNPLSDLTKRAAFERDGWIPGELVDHGGVKYVYELRGGSADETKEQTAVLSSVSSGQTKTVPVSTISRPSDVSFSDPLVTLSRDFKDSKVRDENGNLKLVTHATPDADFDELDVAHANDRSAVGPGIYSTEAPQESSDNYSGLDRAATLPGLIAKQKANLARLEAEAERQQQEAQAQGLTPEQAQNYQSTSNIELAKKLIAQNEALYARTAPRTFYHYLNIKTPFEFDEPLSVENRTRLAAVAEKFVVSQGVPVSEGMRTRLDRMKTDYSNEDPNSVEAMFGSGSTVYSDVSEIINSVRADVSQRNRIGSTKRITNALLQEAGYDGIHRPLGLGTGAHWIAFRNDQIIPPWAKENVEIRSTSAGTPARLLNKMYGDFLTSSGLDKPDAPTDIPFSQLLKKFAGEYGINGEELPKFQDYIESRLGQDLQKKHLSDDLRTRMQSMQREITDTRLDDALDVSKVALHHGLYIEQVTGSGINVRDLETGEIIHRTNSPSAAMDFVKRTALGNDLNLDDGGSVPPRVFGSGLLREPPPEGGPHSTKYAFLKDGPLAHLRAGFNASFLGSRITPMKEVLEAFDHLHDTNLMPRIWYELSRAYNKKYAAMNAEVSRVAGYSKLARNLSPDELAHTYNWLETMSAEQIPLPRAVGGLLTRGMNESEVKIANDFAGRNIDMTKVTQYNNISDALNKTLGKSATQEDITAAHQDLAAQMNLDQSHLDAALQMRMIRDGNQGDLSHYAIVRLTNALLHGDLTRDDYAKKSGMSPQSLALAKAVDSHFKDLADGVFNKTIGDHRILGGYISHLRVTGDDYKITLPSGRVVNTSDLLRLGEMDQNERDPISVMMRYLNMGFNDIYTREPLERAAAYLQQVENTLGTKGTYIKNFVLKNYIGHLRGIPYDSDQMNQTAMSAYLAKIGVDLPVNVKRDMTNTFLSLTNASLIGGKPAQGIRDGVNILENYFVRFGPTRAATFARTLSRWTPEQLKSAGLVKDLTPGESVPEALAREGTVTNISPVAVESQEERNIESVIGKASRLRTGINAAAKLGLATSGQHTVYQFAGAASYLESMETTLNELVSLAEGKYGQDAAAKAKAYKNLSIESYQLGTQKEFDRLVSAGEFKNAAEFLAHTTQYETVTSFGAGNNPVGWSSDVGRIFGQFGRWTVWQRSQMMRLATQGSAGYRAAVAARLALSQGAIKAVSVASGFNLASWYYPFAGSVIAAGGHTAGALHETDPAAQKKLRQLAEYESLFGLAGGVIPHGGPALQILLNSSALAEADAQGNTRDQGEAVSQLHRSWMLGFPMSYAIGDVFDAAELMKDGYNPLTYMAKGIGIPILKNTPSALEPTGVMQDNQGIIPLR